MKELALKYGCNPNQKPARIFMTEGELPIEVLNGKPGYINFCDAFNSWQLVRALKKATGLPAAASFKHVSPAGAALGKPLTDIEKQMYFVDTDKELSPIACAYIRARGADRLCSYGDWAALSDTCDADTASYLAHEVSDGIIAPDFTAEALEILKTKRKGGYNVVKIDPNYEPKPIEQRDIFGIRFEQGYNNYEINESLLTNIVTENKNLPESAKHDMILALITLKYTQSNSVCYVKDGMTIGVGAGQQSRIHCTRLAGQKADNWYLRQHPKVLALQFVDGIRRPDRDNAIDIYTSDEYEDILADIKNGVMYSKSVDGQDQLMMSYNPADIGTSTDTKELYVKLDNGEEHTFGPYETNAEMLAAVKPFCTEQVKLGNMKQSEADEILSRYAAE